MKNLEKEIEKTESEIRKLQGMIANSKAYAKGISESLVASRTRLKEEPNNAAVRDVVTVLDRFLESANNKSAGLLKELAAKEAFLSGLQRAMKLTEIAKKSVEDLRKGSLLEKSVNIIKDKGQPMHVEELLKALGKEVNKKNKTSLTGSIGSYARKNQIFVKTAPNTFGLLEERGDIFG